MLLSWARQKTLIIPYIRRLKVWRLASTHALACWRWVKKTFITREIANCYWVLLTYCVRDWTSCATCGIMNKIVLVLFTGFCTLGVPISCELLIWLRAFCLLNTTVIMWVIILRITILTWPFTGLYSWFWAFSVGCLAMVDTTCVKVHIELYKRARLVASIHTW